MKLFKASVALLAVLNLCGALWERHRLDVIDQQLNVLTVHMKDMNRQMNDLKNDLRP